MAAKKNIHLWRKCLQDSIANHDPKGIAVNSTNLGDAYFHMGRYKKAIQHYQKSLDVFTDIGVLSGIAHSNGRLGNTSFEIGQYEKAINYYGKALEISAKLDDRTEIAANKGRLGNVYLKLGNFAQAINCYKTSLEITSDIADLSGRASNNGNLGNAYLSLGDYQKAIEYYKTSLQISTEIGDRSNIASNNGNLGNAYLSLGEYRKAIKYYETGLKISTEIGDRSGIASNNGNLGNAYQSLGDYQKAIEYYKTGLQISTEIEDRLGIASNNGNLDNAYLSLGDYQKAIEYYETGLKISTEIGHRSGIASNNGNLGNAYHNLGEYEKAFEYYKTGLQISTEIGDRSGIASINANLGNAYLSLGDYEKATEYYETGLQISTEIGDRSGIASNNGNLGNAYLSLGDYQKAIEYYETGLKISTEIGDRSGIASNNGNLGNAYRNLGEYQKAIEYYKTGLQISTEIGDRSGIASNNGSLGNAYLSLGDYQKAIEYYETGLKISTEIGDRSGIASNNGNLGNAYRNLGEYQKAIEYYKTGLQISTEIGDRSGIARNNGNLGNVYHSLGEYEKAIGYYKKCLQISTNIGDQSSIARNSSNLGNSFLCLGQYDSGKSYLMESIRLFDRIFFDFVPDHNKLKFTQQYFKSHVFLMSCFLSIGHTDSALLVADLGKAKELHFCIEKQKNTVRMDMFNYACAMWDQIDAGEEQIQFKQFNEIVHEGKTETSILIFAFDMDGFLNVWVFHERVIFRKLEVSLHAISLLITNLLERVNISVARNSSFCSTGSATHICNDSPSKLPKQKPAQVAKHAVENAVGSFSNPMNTETLNRLYEILVHSVKDICEGSKLIIVSDKLLFFTPFSALVDENGHYLSESYSIQITPSLHTLKCSMERSQDFNLGFALFVGNPTVDLPNAAEEVRCLSKLFQATPLIGRQATKEVLLGLLSGASIIHIAAHGEPTRGEIMLAPNSSTDEPCSSAPKEGPVLLTQQDIMSVSVRARLVVLCCCDTGKGKISSEGVIGITRSFLASGARCVVATLWPIDDCATKEFMETFYGELCKETSVCKALKRTMNLFQKHKMAHYRAIKIWAPFTIYGEDVKFTKNEIEEIRKKSCEKMK